MNRNAKGRITHVEVRGMPVRIEELMMSRAEFRAKWGEEADTSRTCGDDLAFTEKGADLCAVALHDEWLASLGWDKA